MNGHWHLSRLSLLVALLAGAAIASTPDTRPALGRPNVVYILCDDLGYGDVHCLNPQRGRINTPNIDAFASQGMTFSDAHSGSAVCTPTRYGILTGRYAWRTRLQAGVMEGNQPPLIAAGRLTVPEMLRRHGYHTACIGKWHLGYTFDKPGREVKGSAGVAAGTRIIEGPIIRGFDAFFGFSHARAIRTLIEGDRVVEEIEDVQMLPRLAERATRYIGERAAGAKAGRPFFLYLPLSSPHTPIVPSTEWKGRSGLNAYGDFVMQTDAVVGQVLAALDQHGLRDSTLVIFTSDNGCSPQAGTKRLEELGHLASAGFRGYKSDIWDGGHRVPFFVRWPGKVKPGSQSGQLICLTDLMATLADVIGEKLPHDAGEDSVSILPALLEEDKAPLREAVVHHSINGRFAIRRGQWKLAFCAGSGGWSAPADKAAAKQGLPPCQLYDMAADPAEANNLQSQHPEVVEQLTKLLEGYIANGRSTPGKAQANDVTVSYRKEPQ